MRLFQYLRRAQSTTKLKLVQFLQARSIAELGMYTAIFAVFLSFLQLREARIQTHVTQRAWVRFRYQGEEKGLSPPINLNVYQPIMLPTELMNVGATPALDTEAVLVVEVLPVDKEPEFPSDLPRPKAGATLGRTLIGTKVGTTWASGVIYPNQAAYFNTQRFRQEDGSVIGWDLDVDEYKSLKDLKAYVVLWGKVWYKDIFGVGHWVTFCSPTAFGELEVLDHDRYPKCANYNQADTNDGTGLANFLKAW